MIRFAIHVAALVLASVILFGIWFAVPSSIFLRPQAIVYERDADGRVHTVFLRETPFGTVRAKWTAEGQVIASAVECAERGESEYQPIPASPQRVANTVRWPTSPEMLRCVEASRPVIVQYRWQVVEIHGFSVPPLRAVSLTVRLD